MEDRPELTFRRVTLSWCLCEDAERFYLDDANGKAVPCPASDCTKTLRPRRSWICTNPDCDQAHLSERPPENHECRIW